jgi:tripartite-type tricarboxylate transporter receptor subunit TctC
MLSLDRSPTLPTLASAHEQGLTNFTASVWNGFFFPKETPSAIVRQLNEVTVATLETTWVQTKLQEMGATVVAPARRSPEYLQRFVESDSEMGHCD